MKLFKWFLIFATLVASSVFTSCSKDDDAEVTGLNDFYIEVDLKGGGFDDATLAYNEANMNADLLELGLWNLTPEQASNIFNEFIEEMKYEYIDGMSNVKGTLRMKYTLKTTKGVSIKSKTVCVSDKTAWIE